MRPALTGRMAGNTARDKAQSAVDIERHIELVQPRSSTNPTLEDNQRIREKIKVRAAGKKAMAAQQLSKSASGSAKKRESRLVPAEGGGMGMGMHVE